VKAIRRFSVRPVLPARIAALGDLAMNLRWSWHPPLRDLFESIDPARWATVGQDPVAMLSAVEPDEILFVDSLPHTATGKLLKTALREQYKDFRLEGAA